MYDARAYRRKRYWNEPSMGTWEKLYLPEIRGEGDAQLLEQAQLFDVHSVVHPESSHFGLAASHLRLSHVDQRCLTNRKARLSELLEFDVALHLTVRET